MDMKHIKQIIVGSLALAILCSACSAGGEAVPAADAEVSSPTAVLSVQQSGTGQFMDVPSEAWYAQAVNWCLENDIMSASSDAAFAPADHTMRVTVADALYRA